MGLSADGSDHIGRGARSEPAFAASDDIGLLERLIVGVAGAESRSIASDLIERFGSLARLLNQFEKRAVSDAALPDAVIFYLRALSHAVAHCWREPVLDKPLLSTSEELLRYLHHKMAFSRVEQFRVLFLDAENKLLADELMWEGTVNGVQVHNREVIARALDHGATALILVHNHPSGSVTPSAEDLRLTRRLVAACEPFDLTIQDHLIISEGACFSMRLRRVMQS